jgi:hypothetical protein
MYEQERKYSVLGFGYNDVDKMETPRQDTNEILSRFSFLVPFRARLQKSANMRQVLFCVCAKLHCKRSKCNYG